MSRTDQHTPLKYKDLGRQETLLRAAVYAAGRKHEYSTGTVTAGWHFRSTLIRKLRKKGTHGAFTLRGTVVYDPHDVDVHATNYFQVRDARHSEVTSLVDELSDHRIIARNTLSGECTVCFPWTYRSNHQGVVLLHRSGDFPSTAVARQYSAGSEVTLEVVTGGVRVVPREPYDHQAMLALRCFQDGHAAELHSLYARHVAAHWSERFREKTKHRSRRTRDRVLARQVVKEYNSGSLNAPGDQSVTGTPDQPTDDLADW